jgi:hypothetical protein
MQPPWKTVFVYVHVTRTCEYVADAVAVECDGCVVRDFDIVQCPECAAVDDPRAHGDNWPDGAHERVL